MPQQSTRQQTDKRMAIGIAYIKPLSVNKAWQGKRFKSPEYKVYEKQMLLTLKPMQLPEPPYQIDFEFGFSNKASDIDNPMKPFLDILQKKYNFDDANVYKIVIVKTIVAKGSEFIKFEIKTLS
jgi:Holliday junction resolvase RusA-like endonuclease